MFGGSPVGVLNRTSNIRSTPYIQPGNIAQTLSVGTQVQVLVRGAGWNLIAHEGKMAGWIVSWLVDPAQASVQPVRQVQPEQAVSETPILAPPAQEITSTPQGVVQLNSNLRVGPMQAILEVIPKGSVVDILSQDSEWYQVRTQTGRVGWVAAWLVQKTKETNRETALVASVAASQSIGVVPASINTAELNTYWLSKINALRKAQGLRELVVADKLVETAAVWADYMGTQRQLTHARVDGSSMHDWAETQGIPFAQRYAANGWDTNYFTENIGRHAVYATMQEAKDGLDRILASFISENNGPHYRTVYHEDWNSVGSGFYFDPVGAGKYQMYAAFHYGSLK